MKDSKKALILFCIFIILSIIDCITKYRKCVISQPKIIPEILLHRLINVFVYFAWLFNNKIILIFYILFAIGLVIHWYTNNWQCILTTYENKVCKFDKDSRYDYIFRIFNHNIATIITVIIKIIILIIIFWKLLK